MVSTITAQPRGTYTVTTSRSYVLNNILEIFLGFDERWTSRLIQSAKEDSSITDKLNWLVSRFACPSWATAEWGVALLFCA